MLTLESPTIYCGNTMCNDCLLGAFLWWCSTWDQNQQMINKITDCSVSVVNKCQLQTHVGHCNQILGHILGYSLKISEKSVSKIYIKKNVWNKFFAELYLIWSGCEQPNSQPLVRREKQRNVFTLIHFVSDRLSDQAQEADQKLKTRSSDWLSALKRHMTFTSATMWAKTY